MHFLQSFEELYMKSMKLVSKELQIFNFYCKNLTRVSIVQLTFLFCHSNMYDTEPFAKGFFVMLSTTLLMSQGKSVLSTNSMRRSTPKSVSKKITLKVFKQTSKYKQQKLVLKIG